MDAERHCQRQSLQRARSGIHHRRARDTPRHCLAQTILVGIAWMKSSQRELARTDGPRRLMLNRGLRLLAFLGDGARVLGCLRGFPGSHDNLLAVALACLEIQSMLV